MPDEPPREVTVSTVLERNKVAIAGLAIYALAASTVGLILSIHNLWSRIL